LYHNKNSDHHSRFQEAREVGIFFTNLSYYYIQGYAIQFENHADYNIYEVLFTYFAFLLKFFIRKKNKKVTKNGSTGMQRQ